MGTIYNPRAIIDDGYMYNFTAIIHEGELSIISV